MCVNKCKKLNVKNRNTLKGTEMKYLGCLLSQQRKPGSFLSDTKGCIAEICLAHFMARNTASSFYQVLRSVEDYPAVGLFLWYFTG